MFTVLVYSAAALLFIAALIICAVSIRNVNRNS